MSKEIKIKKFNFTFVFIHKWDTKGEYNYEFREYRIGPWFKKNKVVGEHNFNKPNQWVFVNDYMIGLDMIVFKFWVEFNYGGMSL